MIYLDYNATTPVAPEVLEDMLPFLRGGYGNPSSSHMPGRQAHEAIEAARGQVAKLIGACPDEIVFTSGGTEATNLALRGVVLAQPHRRHIVTSSFEHPATAETCLMLERQGFRVTRVRVASDGRIRTKDVAAALEDEPALVTVMHANNEIGTIQPDGAIAQHTVRQLSRRPWRSFAGRGPGNCRVNRVRLPFRLQRGLRVATVQDVQQAAERLTSA